MAFMVIAAWILGDVFVILDILENLVHCMMKAVGCLTISGIFCRLTVMSLRLEHHMQEYMYQSLIRYGFMEVTYCLCYGKHQSLKYCANVCVGYSLSEALSDVVVFNFSTSQWTRVEPEGHIPVRL